MRSGRAPEGGKLTNAYTILTLKRRAPKRPLGHLLGLTNVLHNA